MYILCSWEVNNNNELILFENYFKTKKSEKICTDFNYAQKITIAKKISIRIDQLSSSNSTEDLILSHVGRCHSLKGNRSGQFALDLSGPYRLIFIQHQDEIIVAKIIEIIDYH